MPVEKDRNERVFKSWKKGAPIEEATVVFEREKKDLLLGPTCMLNRMEYFMSYSAGKMTSPDPLRAQLVGWRCSLSKELRQRSM